MTQQIGSGGKQACSPVIQSEQNSSPIAVQLANRLQKSLWGKYVNQVQLEFDLQMSRHSNCINSNSNFNKNQQIKTILIL